MEAGVRMGGAKRKVGWRESAGMILILQERYVGVSSSYLWSYSCWPCSLSSPFLWWGKGPWWFGSRVGGITRVSLDGCQMDKTFVWVVSCHQEGGF